MAMLKVSVNIVTFNSADDIEGCLTSLQKQTFRDFRVRLLDNGSSDDTIERSHVFDVDLTRSAKNLGFAKAHNELIRKSESEYVLVLNPDTVLRETFLQEIVRGLEARPDAGSASGKLLRMDHITIDSTGITMLRSQRHLDRGAGQPDLGQFDTAEDIFGPSGAAALYRRTALEDAAMEGEYFDEDFFAYREDADLAWRLRLLRWNAIYVPSATALHRRRVTPERRSQLPGLINYHSVKNRFLLRINNMTCDLYKRDFWRITGRDAMVVGYVFLREWSSAPALGYVVRYLPRLWRKRRIVQSKVRVAPDELSRWFN
jgi:GT2 family glycosyltransferase